jgi:pimeloyl-ACP methyl ester carboxylesterase
MSRALFRAYFPEKRPGASDRRPGVHSAAMEVGRSFPHVDGVRHRFVETSRLRMHVAEFGPLDGEPAMLVHGWPQHWYEWRGVAPRLADRGYRVICPDLRGLGWSDAPPRGYLKEEMAKDLVALLDALELETVNLAGHDWGGFFGFLICLRHPERVRRYLACNIIHPWLRVRARDIRGVRSLSYQWLIAIPGVNRRVLNDPAFMHRFLKAGSPHKEAWTDEDVEIFAERLRDPARIKASAGIYRTFNTREFLPLVMGRYRKLRLRTPTLALFGVHDFVMAPHNLEGFEPYADDMRVELVEDAAHFIVEELPELVTARALELFRH